MLKCKTLHKLCMHGFGSRFLYRCIIVSPYSVIELIMFSYNGEIGMGEIKQINAIRIVLNEVETAGHLCTGTLYFNIKQRSSVLWL